MVTLQSPHRSERRYRVDGHIRTLKPDGYAQVRVNGQDLHVFLEWERRALDLVLAAAGFLVVSPEPEARAGRWVTFDFPPDVDLLLFPLGLLTLLLSWYGTAKLATSDGAR